MENNIEKHLDYFSDDANKFKEILKNVKKKMENNIEEEFLCCIFLFSDICGDIISYDYIEKILSISYMLETTATLVYNCDKILSFTTSFKYYHSHILKKLIDSKKIIIVNSEYFQTDNDGDIIIKDMISNNNIKIILVRSILKLIKLYKNEDTLDLYQLINKIYDYLIINIELPALIEYLYNYINTNYEYIEKLNKQRFFDLVLLTVFEYIFSNIIDDVEDFENDN